MALAVGQGKGKVAREKPIDSRISQAGKAFQVGLQVTIPGVLD